MSKPAQQISKAAATRDSPPESISAAEFLVRLRDSRLLSDRHLDSLLEQPPEVLQGDAQRLIAKLLHDGRLTEFQVDRLLHVHDVPLILGEYSLQAELGQGGMGTVYRAVHRRMKRTVAIKVLRHDLAVSEVLSRRFMREVEVAARLVHPNIVTAYDAGEEQGVSYLVCEFVEGQNLSDVVRQYGPLSLPLAVDVILQAAQALEYAHGQGVVHRDIKPSNLLLDDDGNVKLLDVGLARINEELSSDQPDASALTMPGTLMGTVDYMSPEQARNVQLADERSDIYSLGCTLYFLLTGRPPYGRGTAMERLFAHREESIPSLRKLAADFPPSIDVLLRDLLAKSPADRIQSMSELIQRLSRLVESPLPEFALPADAVAASSPQHPSDAEHPDDSAAAAMTIPEKAADQLSVAAKRPVESGSTELLESSSLVELERRATRPESISPADAPLSPAGAPTAPVAVPVTTSRSDSGDHRARISRRSAVTRGLGISAAVILVTMLTVRLNQDPEETVVPPDASSDAEPRSEEQALTGPGSIPVPDSPSNSSADPESSAGTTPLPGLLLADYSERQVRDYRQRHARTLGVPETRVVGGVDFQFVPAGEYLSGLQETKDVVIVTTAFYLSTTEVTVGQFREFAEAVTDFRTAAENENIGWGVDPAGDQWHQAPGYSWKNLGGQFISDQHPATNLTYSDVQAFCAWMTESTGSMIRLPSVAEWEYACRCGRRGDWSFGNDELLIDNHAWYLGNSGSRLHPVAQKQPNAWGFFDMHGNEFEWCLAPDELVSQGQGVIRGGGFQSTSGELRCSVLKTHPLNSPTHGGFRILMELPTR